jgi:hypothetical protein
MADVRMKPLQLLLLGFAFAVPVNAGEATFKSIATNPAGTHPALYSFVDVYRLTVTGVGAGFPPVEGAADAPVRVAVAAPSAGAELRFLVSSVPQPYKWLLILAGVALAGWVAHRRMVHSL